MSLSFSLKTLAIIIPSQIIRGTIAGLCNTNACANGYQKIFGKFMCAGYKDIKDNSKEVIQDAADVALREIIGINETLINTTITATYEELRDAFDEQIEATVKPFVYEARPEERYCPRSSGAQLSLPSYLSTIQSMSNFLIEMVIDTENKDTLDMESSGINCFDNQLYVNF